jgi:hypothetical protein
VRRGQGNGWSALDHVEARKDSSRRIAEPEHSSVSEPSDRPAAAPSE